MRANYGANDVVRCLNARHPVAKGLVHRIAKRLGAAADRTDLSTEQPHAVDIRRLAANILFAHIDDAFEAKMCTCRGCCDAVLAGPGFGDDAALAHPHREQGLPERIVDFVSTGMVQVLALQPNLPTTAL